MPTGLPISAGVNMNIYVYIHQVFILAAMIMLFGSCTGGENKADQQILRLYANAHELYSNGRFSETAELLNSVNNFTPALTLRAKAEYFSGDINRAENTFKMAVKTRPGNFEAKLYLARILRDRGEGAKAKQLVENLLADNPHDVRALRFAATLSMELGDIAGASVHLDQAAELSAESAMVLLDRARLYWIAGKGGEALEDLTRARAMLPWDTPIARSIDQLENRITEAMQ